MAGIRARRATKATFLTTIKPIIDAHPELFTEKVEEEHWRHVFTLITTRSFYIEELDTYGMVPWADMYNHSHTTLHDRKLFCRDLKAFMVYADRAYEANKQVFITYGERLSNPQLLLNFGFIIPDNFTVMPLVRLPPLFELDSIHLTQKSGHGDPPSLAYLAASSAHLALEIGGDTEDISKYSDSLRKLYRCAKAWHSSSPQLQLRTPVDSEDHFIKGLVNLMRAYRQQDLPTLLASEVKPRLAMLAALRQWEELFLARFLSSLSLWS